MPEWKYQVQAGGRIRMADPPYQMSLLFDPHVVTADEPMHVGGGDTGPDPFELLAASLAACTSITVKMYAAHKQWPLEQLDVTIHLQNDGTHTHMTRQVWLTGPLTDEQRARLLDVANKCPVHKALHMPIQVETTLMPGEQTA